jgi:hypothetical protein
MVPEFSKREVFMYKNGVAGIRVVCGVIVLFFLLTGCGGNMIAAVQNRSLSLSARMSDTIFLDPESVAKNKSVYVRVTNTSDFQEIDFADMLKKRLQAKGCSITESPSAAGYIVQSNLLYMGQEKKDLTAEGMVAGGFGGALAGSTIGSGWRGPTAGALGLGLVGAVAGAVVGSMVHVDTYFGALDIQIKEASPNAVRGVMTTDAAQGSSTTLHTEREVKSNYQEYRTRIVVTARQTNIDRVEACNAIADRLATQIAGMF